MARNDAFIAGKLIDSSAVILGMHQAPIPVMVRVNPAAGDSVTVSTSTDGAVSFTDWAYGAATIYQQMVLVSAVTHIKFQRTAGTGTTSTYEVI